MARGGRWGQLHMLSDGIHFLDTFRRPLYLVQGEGGLPSSSTFWERRTSGCRPCSWSARRPSSRSAQRPLARARTTASCVATWIAHAHTFLKRGALEAVPGDGISSNWLDAELTHCQAHGLKLQYEIEFTIEQCCGHIMKRERPLFNSKCEHLSCYILRSRVPSTGAKFAYKGLSTGEGFR